MANIYEMDIDQLLYAFQERMTVLIKREASKPQGYEHFHFNQIEDELMPLINEMVDYDPTPQYSEIGEGGGGSSYVKENALLGIMERR